MLFEPATRTALRLSLVVSSAATLGALFLGLPPGWALARARAARGASCAPSCSCRSCCRPWWAASGCSRRSGGADRRASSGGHRRAAAFTTAGAVVAATFVSLPLPVLAVEAGFRALDVRLEDAAATMGASRGYVLRRVTLPLLAPQLAAGLALAWVRAIGEFGATITFAGNLPGRTQTLPLAVYERLQTDPDAAVLLSLVLVGVAVVVLALLHRRLLGAP
ncbi:MAG: ABC transporter permease subunit [Anaerolineae bacterium]